MKKKMIDGEAVLSLLERIERLLDETNFKTWQQAEEENNDSMRLGVRAAQLMLVQSEIDMFKKLRGLSRETIDDFKGNEKTVI